MGSEARIDQLEGHSPESCISWRISDEGFPKHDLFLLEYSIIMCKLNNLFINVDIVL